MKPTDVHLKLPDETQPTGNEHDVFAAIRDLKDSAYSNQTGYFPYTSYCGSRYIMVFVELDTSTIFFEPIKD